MEMDDLQYYRYRLESVNMIVSGKEPVEIEPFRVDSMEILKDYDNLFFPVFRLSLTLRNEDLYLLIKNKTNVKFHIRMIYYEYDENSPKLKSKKNVFDEVFTTFLEEETPNLDEKTMESVKKINHKTDEDRDINDFGSFIELYLFKEKDLSIGKSSVNYVFSNAKLDDVVAFMLSKNGAKKVLMTPLDNKKIFPEVWVPPTTLIGGLHHLEQQYGFYNTYSTIFFDVDTLYLLSRKMPCTAWRNGEKKRTTLIVDSDLSSESFYTGTYEENGNIMVNITKSAIVFNNSSVISDQISGNNMMLVDQNTGDVTNVKSNTVQRGSGNYHVMINVYSNPYLAKCEEFNRTENSKVITVNIMDFDQFMFTPNKEFSMVFKDNRINKEYGGLYRLTQSVLKFTKRDEDFIISGTLTLKMYKK